MTTTTDTAPIIASPDDIPKATADAAFYGTSHTPERRGYLYQNDYADSVNGLYRELWARFTNEKQRAILAEEMERYRDGYKRKMLAFLSAHSRVMSPMITGPARFPVDSNRKKINSADRRMEELMTWKTKARGAIFRALLDARTPEEVDDAEWAGLLCDLKKKGSASIKGKLDRIAAHGDVELIRRALDWLKENRLNRGKPMFTARNRVWGLLEVAEGVKAARDARGGKPHEVIAEYGEVTIWANYKDDRVQIEFPVKPSGETRNKLKAAGWRWSPKNEAWQRKLTEAAKYSARAICEGCPEPL